MLLLFGGVEETENLRNVQTCHHTRKHNEFHFLNTPSSPGPVPAPVHTLSFKSHKIPWSYICSAGKERLKQIRQVAWGPVAGGWQMLALHPRRASSKSIFFSPRHAASPGVTAGPWHLHLEQWLRTGDSLWLSSSNPNNYTHLARLVFFVFYSSSKNFT